MNPHSQPPRYAQAFLRWFIKTELEEEVLGDLAEQFEQNIQQRGLSRARLVYTLQVLQYFRPFAIRQHIFSNLNPFFMWRHHFRVSWRTLFHNKVFSLINIGGLAIGLAVALLLALWVHDETTFNQNHQNYASIAQVFQHRSFGDQKTTWREVPQPLDEMLRNQYGHFFSAIAKCSWTEKHSLTVENETFQSLGDFIQAPGLDILAPKMLAGQRSNLKK
ncbi:MAG: permease prefix domain 2-containing transporter, partial [Bacteroidota bacterium]